MGLLKDMLKELFLKSSIIGLWLVFNLSLTLYYLMVCLNKKGLRQGDPLSPFLFALSMEYLSRCMGVMSKNPDFNYYPKCERLNLTRLMFVDDLIMFASANHNSIRKIMDAFHKFLRASGLKASNEKSCIYFSRVSQDDAAQLTVGIHMPIGLLPFKYLGVLLKSFLSLSIIL